MATEADIQVGRLRYLSGWFREPLQVGLDMVCAQWSITRARNPFSLLRARRSAWHARLF